MFLSREIDIKLCQNIYIRLGIILDDCFQESVEDNKPVFTDNCFIYCAGAKNSRDLFRHIFMDLVNCKVLLC